MTQNSGSAVPPRSGAETQVRRQRVRTSLLLLLLGAVFFVWWSQPPYARASRSQPRWTQYPAQARTEEQWVVGEIGNAIAEMVAFARTRKSAELAELQSEVHSNAQAKEYLVEMQLGEQAPPV